MLYAKVVLGLAVEGPFDYIVPESLYKKIKIGVRVWINFHTKEALGYVVKITKKSNIKNLKSILEVIDEAPILDKNMLLLTKELSDYYCCSWGEAIETALPEGLRKGKLIPNIQEVKCTKRHDSAEINLLHDLDGRARWDMYITQIKEALDNDKSTILLLPDINSVLRAREIIKTRLNCSLGVLHRKQPRELEEWIKIKRGEVNIVIGTRSSIFAPVNNLGLVIIEEEQDESYKQDQVPHYNAREVAFMRANIEKTNFVLGSTSPSLESFYLTWKHKIKHTFISRKRDFPEIKVIDMKQQHLNFKQRNIILSKYLEDSILSALDSPATAGSRILREKGKILLFLNRRGFATSISCRHCGVVLKCPRCNINLVYHFKDNILNCHYCNFKMPVFTICPNCNSGYIRYSGTGVEKIESELSRLFPQARIKRLDNLKDLDINEADMFISTKSIIKQTGLNFDLVGVLSIDNSLNRIDFRASEKAFGLLVGLLGLTEGRLVIQTSLPKHHCFQALENKDVNIFYDEELRQRKQLGFPPFKHLGLVKLRGKNEARVKEVSNALFKRLDRHNKDKNIKIVSVNPGQPSKLRGKFWWQILIKSNNAKKISKFLKIHLKDFSHSGIIVTVDIDPL